MKDVFSNYTDETLSFFAQDHELSKLLFKIINVLQSYRNLIRFVKWIYQIET